MTQFKLDLLSRFKASASAARKQAPIDYRLFPALVVLCLVMAIETIYIALTDLKFPAGLLMQLYCMMIFILCGGMLARHYGMTKIGNTLQAVVVVPIFSVVAVVAMVLLTRFTRSFSDDLLAGADQALGVDWMEIFYAFSKHPVLLEVGRFAYFSFTWQIIFIICALFAGGKPGAGTRFVNAWAIALALSVMIYPFFTAQGPYLRYGIHPSAIPGLHSEAPWTTGPIVEAIRDGRATDVVGSMTGLIFFPSFHAAMAVMLTWAGWQFRWLRWPMLALNLMLIAATPVFGLHYFVDLPGGIAVAVAAIILAEKLTAQLERRAAAHG